MHRFHGAHKPEPVRGRAHSPFSAPCAPRHSMCWTLLWSCSMHPIPFPLLGSGRPTSSIGLTHRHRGPAEHLGQGRLPGTGYWAGWRSIVGCLRICRAEFARAPGGRIGCSRCREDESRSPAGSEGIAAVDIEDVAWLRIIWSHDGTQLCQERSSQRPELGSTFQHVLARDCQ